MKDKKQSVDVDDLLKRIALPITLIPISSDGATTGVIVSKVGHSGLKSSDGNSQERNSETTEQKR